MTKDQAKAWLRVFWDLSDEQLQECRRGHKGCSITPLGECLDEVLESNNIGDDDVRPGI